MKNIARVQHTHLVRLIGYYHDSYQQLLVYDYLSNGNVGNHLYGTLSIYIYVHIFTYTYIYTQLNSVYTDNEGLPIGKLGIRQRLSIAVAAAKGKSACSCLSTNICFIQKTV